MSQSTNTDLVLDLNGVFFSYSMDAVTNIPPRTIKNVFDSPSWSEYERGRISRPQCYEKITKQYCLAPGSLIRAIEQIQSTRKVNDDLVNGIKIIKAAFPHLRVHAFSNIPTAEFQDLKEAFDEWDIFDTITTSSSTGHRKPDLSSYEKFLDLTNTKPFSSILVDDGCENVMTAHALGFHGILFQDSQSVIAQLYNFLGDPVARGMDYLRRNSNNLFTETDIGMNLYDNYCQLLILWCIGERDMVRLENTGEDDYLWRFNVGTPPFDDEGFPKDCDTTALALITLEVTEKQKEMAMERILSNLSPDGLPLVPQPPFPFFFDFIELTFLMLGVCGVVLQYSSSPNPTRVFIFLGANSAGCSHLLKHNNAWLHRIVLRVLN